MNEGISVFIKDKNIIFKFCSKSEESFLDLLKGSVKVEIVNALSNKFSLNDRKKEVASTSEEKDLKLLRHLFILTEILLKKNTYPA